jgi:hypothetical protein
MINNFNKGIFREHLGNIRYVQGTLGTFREHSGNTRSVQGTFKEHSGNIQAV